MKEYPIVQVKTKDNIWLYALYLTLLEKKTVFINIHGTASNFYEEYFIEVLSKRFLEKGISILSTNNRGTGVYDAYEKTGAAVEKFEDCLIDIDAWIEFAIDQGHENIVLSGHSLGSEKIVYYMSNGKYADKINSIVFLAPADSFGSHRMLDGKTNPRINQVETLIKQSVDLIQKGEGATFLPRDSYGSRVGIMPKSAESFVNFLGPTSKLLEALPFAQKKLGEYSKIKVPILVVIGDKNEYTAIPTQEALDLMKQENKNTQTFQIKDCNHDFEGKEDELADIVLRFIEN